jgi:hypothetical protein
VTRPVGPGAAREPAGLLERVVAPLLLAVLLAGYAVHRGPDAGWDLLNYHIYNPFALLNKPRGTDLVPAQLQTFLPPTLDVVPYLIRTRLDGHPALADALLAVPSVVPALIALRIGLLLLPAGAAAAPLRILPVLAALGFGLTGAAGLPTTGTSMSEMPGACFLLAGFWILLREVATATPRPWPVLAAGLLLGTGVGAKLTLAPYALAALAGFLLWSGAGLAARMAEAVRLGAGALLGALAAGGAWWGHLLDTTGNPLFPFYNNLFRSPLLPPASMRDDRFLPRGVWQSLSYAFQWGFGEVRLISEYPVRDPRMALACIAAVAALVQLLRQWRAAPDRRAGYFLTFMAVSYALWEAQFSILRYLAPIELLSGFLILLAVRPMLVAPRPRIVATAALAALAIGVTAYTRYPDWGRARADGHVASLNSEVLPREGMLLLLSPEPMGFVAAFASPALRVVGVNNNIVRPGSETLLARRVEAAVRGFAGPLWGLHGPSASAASIAAVLGYYGLVIIGDCVNVTSNLLPAPLRLCPLDRMSRAASRS